MHTFVAVGAPWLGASKTIRALATGEKFGLDAFLTDVEAITFGHRICTPTHPYTHTHTSDTARNNQRRPRACSRWAARSCTTTSRPASSRSRTWYVCAPPIVD